MLAGFACLGAAFLAGPAARAADAPRLRLRVLETSDLHTAVMDWDYYRAKQDLSQGVVRTASLVRAARAEAPNCLLFDNGDLIQGNPLGDYVARPGGLAAGERHPLVAVLEALGTDAATVGNHEFNFGLDFLERSLAGAKFPFVCANIERADGSDFLPKTVVLERTFVDANGAAHTLRIGVVGFVTPQIMNWDRSKLEGRLKAFDIVDAAHAVVPDLRARADIVVGLCHAGIGGGPRLVGEENAALHLAEAAGLDIVLTGHSHRVFPARTTPRPTMPMRRAARSPACRPRCRASGAATSACSISIWCATASAGSSPTSTSRPARSPGASTASWSPPSSPMRPSRR
ncbi:metallophosphoesterase [Methyloraptor flagellatus]|uniref:Metallophosphoesterase n=1 Tax=Methyloraptor flagellatus TaxID=3162530 RepID=A0AAU7XHI9_9HYPH